MAVLGQFSSHTRDMAVPLFFVFCEITINIAMLHVWLENHPISNEKMGHVTVSNCCKLLPFGSFQQFDYIENDLEIIMGWSILCCTCKSNIVCQLMKWHDCSDFVLKMEVGYVWSRRTSSLFIDLRNFCFLWRIGTLFSGSFLTISITHSMISCLNTRFLRTFSNGKSNWKQLTVYSFHIRHDVL